MAGYEMWRMLDTAETIKNTADELSTLINSLTQDYYLELGDDPDLINDVHCKLQNLSQRLREVESQFDLEHIPLSKSNYYFNAARDIDNAVALARAIEMKAYGSRQHTNQCIDQVSRCWSSLQQVYSVIVSSMDQPSNRSLLISA